MTKIVKTSSHPRALLALVLLCAALLIAWFVYRHQRPGGNTADLLQPPQTAVHSLSDETIAKWTKLLKVKPNDDAAWASLGDAFMEKARETLDLSYYGRAERAYGKAISLNSKNIAATNGMAWINGGRHEFEKCIQWDKKAIALDPTDEPAYGLWGDADQEMGDYEAAYTHYQKMLDLHPDFSSWTRGARWCWLTGNTRKAELLYREAITAGASYKENVAWARAQLGLIYFNDGDYAAAENILLEGLNFSPNNYHLLSIMGRVQAAKKDYA
ncbi:MAG: hypothetical protein M3Y56_09725, partial [Armatimonadota bacterium]|nr:hypothetical protein [Armatimonadota bacterium]